MNGFAHNGPFIILLRHAERLDRYFESKGEDWIHGALRPQDSPISPLGEAQATATGTFIGQRLQVTKVLASPLVRTIQTAHSVCSQLGGGPHSICVELGLVEEAKSLRGKTTDEPKPNWNPLLLTPRHLTEYSDKIDESYESLVTVRHEYDEDITNTVREVHDSLIDQDEVTRDRCRQLVSLLREKSVLPEYNCTLCVGHGASTGGCAAALQEGLPVELRIQGKRNVCSFSVFVPLDVHNVNGPWYAPTGKWEHVAEDVAGVEVVADQGSCI